LASWVREQCSGRSDNQITEQSADAGGIGRFLVEDEVPIVVVAGRLPFLSADAKPVSTALVATTV
jgi:hypothetical protein